MLQHTKTIALHMESLTIKKSRWLSGWNTRYKNDALTVELGDKCNQQKISLLEQKETIDAPLLQQIFAALKIPVEAIQNFDEEQAINIIASTFNDNATGVIVDNYNPIERLFNYMKRRLHSMKECWRRRMRWWLSSKSWLRRDNGWACPSPCCSSITIWQVHG